MKPVKSTAEILSFKLMGRTSDKARVDWAVEMLMVGYDTESLIILAGETEPFYPSEMEDLTSKVLSELGIYYSDKSQVNKNYASYLVEKAINGKVDYLVVLGILRDLYLELDYDKDLKDFYLLYYAYDDLVYDDYQDYWDGATRENIDDIVKTCFIKWLKNQTDENNNFI